MQQILCQQAAEGMVLAKDVETPDGRILCGKDTVLTAAMIARFMKMEISHIAVQGHPVKVAGEKVSRRSSLMLKRDFPGLSMCRR